MTTWIPCARCRRHHEARAERCPFCVAPTHHGLALALAFAGATSLASCARAEAHPGPPAHAAPEPKTPDGGAARDAGVDAGRSDAGSGRRARVHRRWLRVEPVPLYGDPPK